MISAKVVYLDMTLTFYVRMSVNIGSDMFGSGKRIVHVEPKDPSLGLCTELSNSHQKVLETDLFVHASMDQAMARVESVVAEATKNLQKWMLQPQVALGKET